MLITFLPFEQWIANATNTLFAAVANVRHRCRLIFCSTCVIVANAPPSHLPPVLSHDQTIAQHLSMVFLSPRLVDFRNEVSKFEQLARSETKYQSHLRRRFKVLDRSFKLSDKNTAPCHEMFGKEEEEDEGWW